MKCPKCKTKFVPECPECGHDLDCVNPRVAMIMILVFAAWCSFTTFMGTKEHFPEKYNNGYKQGQIDALNNNWKYDMIIQGKLKSDTTYIKIK